MSLDLPQAPEPYLYILMRSDLDSLNPGKKVAQGAHAANQFVFDMRKLQRTVADLEEAGNTVKPDAKVYLRLWEQWESSTPQGFGVTICLDVNGNNLPDIVQAAQTMGVPAGVTHDPSYPIADGRVIHTLPLDTCGYIFGEKPKLRILLGQFDLLA